MGACLIIRVVFYLSKYGSIYNTEYTVQQKLKVSQAKFFTHFKFFILLCTAVSHK